MKHLLTGLVLAGFVIASLAVAAEEQKEAAKEQPAVCAPAHGELTLTGKLLKKEQVEGSAKIQIKEGVEKETVKEAAKETTTWKYILATADGDVVLPEPKAKAGEETIVLEKFLDKNVKVVAKGHETTKDGKKHIKVSKVLKVEEAAEAAAPAAPAAQ